MSHSKKTNRLAQRLHRKEVVEHYRQQPLSAETAADLSSALAAVGALLSAAENLITNRILPLQALPPHVSGLLVDGARGARRFGDLVQHNLCIADTPLLTRLAGTMTQYFSMLSEPGLAANLVDATHLLEQALQERAQRVGELQAQRPAPDEASPLPASDE